MLFLSKRESSLVAFWNVKRAILSTYGANNKVLHVFFVFLSPQFLGLSSHLRSKFFSVLEKQSHQVCVPVYPEVQTCVSVCVCIQDNIYIYI